MAKVKVTGSGVCCPKCGSEFSRVVDSRYSEKSPSRKRRRECDECGIRYSTSEIEEGVLKELNRVYDLFQKVVNFTKEIDR